MASISSKKDGASGFTEATEAPEGFTLGLALVDAVPVLEFGATMLVVAGRLGSPVFAVGAVACALAGAGKVAWKLVLALAGRDVPWLASQFRYVMSAGFLLMVVGVVAAAAGGSLDLAAVAARAASGASGACLAAGLVGMVAMGVMAAHLDRRNARHNWAEQLVNAAAQAAFLAAALLY